jgi:hypothetical protein
MHCASSRSSIARERAASADVVTLIWAKVALGKCKDFGARCRSSLGNDAAEAAGLPPGLRDWGPPIGRRGEGTFKIPPSGCASVTGTEGDLKWAAHPRLKERGAELGRQYVTFETRQAYPELVLRLVRRADKTQEFRDAEEQVMG